MAGLQGPHGPLKAGLHAILLSGTALSGGQGGGTPAPAGSFPSFPASATVGQTLTIAYAGNGLAGWRPVRNTVAGGTNSLGAQSGSFAYTPADIAPGSTWQLCFQLLDATGAVVAASPTLTVQEPAVRTVVLNPAGPVTPGSAFSVSGTLSQYATQPVLSVSVDGAAAIAMSSTSPYGLAFTPGAGAPSSFTFTAQALSSGTHTIQVTDTANGVSSNTISVTAAVQGSGGGTSTWTPGSLPSFRVQAVAAMPAGTPVTLGHFFAKGDIPAGASGKVIVQTTGGQTAQVQVDQVNTWPADGSLRFAALSFLSPIAFTAGQVAGFQFAAGTNAISTAALTPAQIVAAAGDSTIHVSGGDYGADTFTVSANDVLTNLAQVGTSAAQVTDYPLGGWEVIRSGPVCTEYRCWRYLKRDGDGASHTQTKAKLYLRAWGNGSGGIQGIEPLPGLFQENSYGPHPSATAGSTAPQAYAGAVSLAVGGTTVQAYTGPGGANPVTHPQRGWWGALADGSRPWVGVGGAAKPSYMVAHDAAYSNATRCLPPYDYQAVAAQAAAGVSLAIPAGQAQTYTVNVSNLNTGINGTGNDNNDPRYGYLSVDSAALLLNPLDQLRQQTVLAYGWSWADWNMWICDERSGWPLNTGTDSSTCPSPANPSFVMYNNGARGSPAWWTFGPQNAQQGQFNYGPNWDNSHTPSLWIMPLLRTGDAAFEEMALFQCSVSCAAYDQGGRNFSFGGTNYENVVIGLYQMEGAERAGANWIRQFGAASRMVRSSHPMKGYVDRALSQNAACAGSGNIPYAAAALAKFGIFGELVSDTGPASKGDAVFPHLFMTSLLAHMVGVEARVGDYPGWRTLLAAMQPIFVGVYDTATGGSSYDFTLYNPTWSDGTTVYADLPAMRSQNGIAGTPPSTGFRYGSSADQGLGNTSGIPRAAIYMAGWLDQPITNAVAVAQESYTRYKATYPSQAGVINYTTFSANNGHGLCPQFAIAPPPGVS